MKFLGTLSLLHNDTVNTFLNIWPSKIRLYNNTQLEGKKLDGNFNALVDSDLAVKKLYVISFLSEIVNLRLHIVRI